MPQWPGGTPTGQAATGARLGSRWTPENELRAPVIRSAVPSCSTIGGPRSFHGFASECAHGLHRAQAAGCLVNHETSNGRSEGRKKRISAPNIANPKLTRP